LIDVPTQKIKKLKFFRKDKKKKKMAFDPCMLLKGRREDEPLTFGIPLLPLPRRRGREDAWS
jgi:hypothetical protein